MQRNVLDPNRRTLDDAELSEKEKEIKAKFQEYVIEYLPKRGKSVRGTLLWYIKNRKEGRDFLTEVEENNLSYIVTIPKDRIMQGRFSGFELIRNSDGNVILADKLRPSEVKLKRRTFINEDTDIKEVEFIAAEVAKLKKVKPMEITDEVEEVMEVEVIQDEIAEVKEVEGDFFLRPDQYFPTKPASSGITNQIENTVDEVKEVKQHHYAPYPNRYFQNRYTTFSYPTLADEKREAATAKQIKPTTITTQTQSNQPQKEKPDQYIDDCYSELKKLDYRPN